MADKVGGVAKGTQDKVGGVTSGLLGSLEAWGNWLASWGKGLLDKIFPPEKRAAFLAKLQAFMLKNPKLSTFLGMNLALTGVPLFLFVLFSLTVFIFALVVGLLAGVLGAVAFTLFSVGVALMVVLPTVLFTTMAATFLFLWGLGGYYILKWANGEGSGKSSGQEGGGPSIGDRLNSLTGGRLTGFMNNAKNEESKKSIEGYGDDNTPAKSDEKLQSSQQNGKAQPAQQTNKHEANGSPKPKPKANGSPAPQKSVSDASNATSNGAKKATDAAGGATGGAQKAVGSTAGTVTGGLGAATGTA